MSKITTLHFTQPLILSVLNVEKYRNKKAEISFEISAFNALVCRKHYNLMVFTLPTCPVFNLHSIPLR